MIFLEGVIEVESAGLQIEGCTLLSRDKSQIKSPGGEKIISSAVGNISLIMNDKR